MNAARARVAGVRPVRLGVARLVRINAGVAWGVGVVLLAAAARGQPELPTLTLYSLAPLPAELRGNPRIVAMVKLWPFVEEPAWRAATPEEAADLAITTIRRRVREGSLPADRLHLHMTWFGTWDPTLKPEYANVARVLFHPEDALPEQFGGAALAEHYRTLWHPKGVAEGRAWMERFVRQYARRRAQVPNIPNPALVTFDTESPAFPEDFSTAARLFDAMRADPRYADPAFPVARTGRTLKALYEAAGAPRYTAAKYADFRGTHEGAAYDNLGFSDFYRTLACDARAAAIDDSVRGVLSAAWPGVRYGDVASRTFDGAESPAAPPFGPRVPQGQSYAWWRMATTGPADFDVAYFYDIWNPTRRTDESHWDSVLRMHRATLEAMIFSPAPNRPAPRSEVVMPWILLPGQESGKQTHQPDEADTRRMLRLLVALGIREAMVFGTDPAAKAAANWRALAGALGDATASVVRAARVTIGPANGPQPDPALLRRALWDLWPLAWAHGGEAQAEIDLDTTLAGRERLVLTVECSAPAGLRGLTLEAFDSAAGAWRGAGAATPADLRRGGRVILEYHAAGDGAALIDAAGGARLRVTARGDPAGLPVAIDYAAVAGE